MANRYREMTQQELIAEAEAWQRVIDELKGPGTAGNAQRDEAARQRDLAMAWYHRRRIESLTQ